MAKKVRADRSRRLSTRFIRSSTSCANQSFLASSAIARSRPAPPSARPRCVSTNEADFQLVEAQIEQRVVELAEGAQRPGVGAGLAQLVGGLRRWARRPRTVSVGDALLGLRPRASRGGTWSRCRRASASSGGSRTPGPLRSLALATSVAAAAFTASSNLPSARDLVDEAPLDGALAAHALGDGAERVGEIAAHLALVDEAREAAGAGEHAEERHLGQADRAGAVVRRGRSRRTRWRARSRRRTRCR